MSTVKVGDRVRATCGESVIAGIVERIDSGGCYVNLTSCDISLWLYGADWTVEVLAPPIPDNRGTVVLDRYDSAWQRWASGWQAIGGDKSDMRTLPQLMFGFGPLTVLWTPEATP